MRFKPVRPSDISLLSNWFEAPHVKRFYDSGCQTPADLSAKYGSHNPVSRNIAYLNDTPFGYIQSYPINSSLSHPTGKTVGIDLFIGEPDFLGKGYGKEMLKAFISLQPHDVERIILDPANDNARAISLFRQYGFQERSGVMCIDIRRAVRAIILNENNEILLIHIKSDPLKSNQRDMHSFWMTPGGKIEYPESKMEALAREIREETGITDYTLKGEIASSEKTVIWDSTPLRFMQTYFLLTSFTRELEKQKSLMKDEEALFLGYKWWSFSELTTTQEAILPQNLVQMLRDSCPHFSFA